MGRFKDQLGRTITLKSMPKRVVSVVPSQSELLFDLGLNDYVVGLTKFCVNPKGWKKTKSIIGGTKNLNLKKIAALQPDLVIANKEENEQGQIEELKKICPVWVSNVKRLNDNHRLIRSMGRIFNKRVESKKLIYQIKSARAKYLRSPNTLSCAYLIWQKPYMTVGGDTFIHTMIEEAGLTNAFANYERYPVTSIKKIKEIGADIILLSSEPFPFKSSHVKELIRSSGLPCLLVNGEMFSWYGSRIKKAYPYFEKIFNI